MPCLCSGAWPFDRNGVVSSP
uniref:Uncharacterized protein n=1 Tax=Anguilla anguilla TaxID=7936 RepID=A0A0E9RRL0_ANGAN